MQESNYQISTKESDRKVKIIECVQGTAEWHEARRGKVTASCFADALAKGEGKTRMAYMCKLLAERLTGEIDENGYTSKYIQWGNEWEWRARLAYELETGQEVSQVGFVALDENIGASPDSLVGEDGLVQIKCPASHTHVKYIIDGVVPTEHMKQIQGELWVTGRQWSDFVSYDPRNRYRDIFIYRVERDEKFIANLKDGIDKFVDELLSFESAFKGIVKK